MIGFVGALVSSSCLIVGARWRDALIGLPGSCAHPPGIPE